MQKSDSLRIALIYVVICLTWIFLSDRLLFLFKNNLSEDVFQAVNSGKGFAFVIATGVLLFILIRKSSKQIVYNQNEYRELYESNPSPMWIYDPVSLKFVSVNETAISVYGYSKQEFLSMTIKDIRPIEDHVKLIKAINVGGKFKRSGIWKHIKKDGSFIHAEISSNRILFKGKDAVMVLARDHSSTMVSQDMLEKANMDLADDQKRLMDIQQLSKIAGWDYFLINRKLTISDEAFKIFGIEKGLVEPSYNLFLKFLHRDDQSRFLADAHATMVSGCDLDTMFRLFLGKNNVMHIRLLGKVEERDGKPYKIRGTMQDITEIKQIEHEKNLVSNENKKLGNIITKINNMVVIEDAESRITWVNKAFENFTGYTLDEIEGLRPSQFITNPVDEKQLDTINEAQKRFESFAVDLMNYTKNGEAYWVNIEFTPMFDDDQFIGYISIHNNITVRKEKEAEITEQNSVLKNIAWLSSHEIRRPAASILGLMDLIRNTNDVKEKEEYLAMLNDCTLHLDEIIHQINDTIYLKLSKAQQDEVLNSLYQ
ncbi:MAG: PAS domain S-box protein [Mucilaginibacter sp.]|uniref:PAS domain S-box protein n=1 Tax=Mucilaginibacter sp. TaxID=1882438 RepID=UPI0032658AC2